MSIALVSRFQHLRKAVPYLILILISFFPLFINLGKFPIRMWDEATYANNAIDMLSFDNPLVVEHMGQPDMYNTKPPLVIWLQAAAMKIFGINEWSVRMPSAMFGLLTV